MTRPAIAAVANLARPFRVPGGCRGAGRAVVVLLVALAATSAWAAAGETAGRVAALHEGGAEERRDAAIWLGQHADSTVIPDLVRALRDRDRVVRMVSESAIWSIWMRSGNEEVDHYLAVGTRHLQAQQYERALEDFGKAVAAGGEFPEAYNKRATALYHLGRFRESLADIDETLKRNPYHFGALSGAGLCRLGLGEPASALDYFERALEINPNLPGVQSMIARLRSILSDKML